MLLPMIAWTRRFAAEHRWLTLIAGCIAFGVGMAARTEFEHVWQRTLVAAVAFSVFGLTLSLQQNKSASR